MLVKKHPSKKSIWDLRLSPIPLLISTFFLTAVFSRANKHLHYYFLVSFGCATLGGYESLTSFRVRGTCTVPLICFGDTGGLVCGVAGAVLVPLLPSSMLRSSFEPTRDGGAEPKEREIIHNVTTMENKLSYRVSKNNKKFRNKKVQA